MSTNSRESRVGSQESKGIRNNSEPIRQAQGRLRTPNSKLIFITGGARSGKSAFALSLANSITGDSPGFTDTPPQSPLWQGGGNRGGRIGTVPSKRKCYLATAQPLDSEMEERIARHKAERGPDWDCIEEPLQVSERMEVNKGKYEVILFDCLTLWVSNMMHNNVGAQHAVPLTQIDALISACKASGSTVIVVSNEVGLGIVPDNPMARGFRDLAGTANQLFAKAADEAYLVVSGIPMRLK